MGGFNFFLLLLVGVPLRCLSSKPNVLVILTDDQDEALHGMFPMQEVERWITMKGAIFRNSFTTSPMCCPSRASLLSGMYAHNHRTTNNSLSGGCNADHWRQKVEPDALPVLMERAGYSTFYAGKYLNEYRGDYKPPGWQRFYGLHGNSKYYNYTLRENDRNVNYTTEYLTDKLASLAVKFLQNWSKSEEKTPFFAVVAPPAAHAPFTPADRHRGRYSGQKALRTPNFNILSDKRDKHWLVSNADPIPPQTVTRMDEIFGSRWETLLSVDELVSRVMESLEKLGELDNTYVVYTSDNGYHIGQFAQPFDKRQPYETDIRVPLMIRGPGIQARSSVTAAVALMDLYPTILEWARVLVPPHVDGLSFHAYLVNAGGYDATSDKDYHRSLLIQHWGEGNEHTFNEECPYQPTDRLSGCTLDADCHCQDSWNNTYACMRQIGYDTNRLYCEFKDEENFIEVFDVGDDPFQMTNLAYDLLPIEMAFYNLALANLTKCAGSSCGEVHI